MTTKDQGRPLGKAAPNVTTDALNAVEPSTIAHRPDGVIVDLAAARRRRLLRDSASR